MAARMDPDDDLARERIARLARQLLRQERRAMLHTDGALADHARSILESARTIHLDAIDALAVRVEDVALRARCGELRGLYDALARTPDDIDAVHAALVSLVSALPPAPTSVRVRLAVRTA